jgi:hypothetical protein
VPPSLADPTEFRLKSGTLTGNEIINAALTYDVRAMLLWSDGLRDVKRFGDWVDAQYRPVRIAERTNRKDRALYLRNDADLAAARQVLRAGLSTAVQADFGDQVRLAAAGLDATSVRPNGSLTVTSDWEAITPLAVDYAVLAILRGLDGQPVAQIQRSLGGGGAGTAAWEAGRWTVRSFSLMIPPRTPPGDYRLALAIYDAKARRQLPLRYAPLSGPADEAPIGVVQVR